MQRLARSILIVLALLATGVVEAAGQGRWVVQTRREPGDRPRLDYFVSRFQQEGQGGEAGQDAVGGRLMWSLAEVMPEPGSWVDRTSVGAYLVHSPEVGGGSEVWRYGVQADVRLLPASLTRRVEPLASLGLGACRREAFRPAAARIPYALQPVGREVDTSLSLAPGMGVRVRLLPGIALRGDARQVIDFQDGRRRNLEISGGLSVGG